MKSGIQWIHTFFSPNVLTDEPSSLLDFDDAFNQGIADMLTPGATPATPAHGLKEENPSTPTQASVEMENDVATPTPDPEAQMVRHCPAWKAHVVRVKRVLAIA